MIKPAKNTICLWCNGDVEEAVGVRLTCEKSYLILRMKMAP